MNTKHKEKDQLDQLSDLIDRINQADPDYRGMFDFVITPPYSAGRKPEPVRWESGGIGIRKAK